MKPSSALETFCLLTSLACLGTGYLLAGYGWVTAVLPALAIVWLLLRRKSGFWAASCLLFAVVFLAGIGITMDLSLPLMVIGCAAGLAYWDLSNFRQSTPVRTLTPQEALPEKQHLQSLAGAVFSGLVLALAGSALHLRLPFAITALLILTAVGCLTYGFYTVLHND